VQRWVICVHIVFSRAPRAKMPSDLRVRYLCSMCAMCSHGRFFVQYVQDPLKDKNQDQFYLSKTWPILGSGRKSSARRAPCEHIAHIEHKSKATGAQLLSWVNRYEHNVYKNDTNT
jgi:hypothetical protein